ncbi:LysR family transcriptional regulator [Paraburkholderia xenovorans]|uniref:LysR family transcriptional regulator n=1 Tax=Paraburkholderia xenovorans TaxID=36873 RepID=UPI0038B93F8C
MNVNIRQLEAFIQVARLGSFSHAANRLHLTQAGLSILIRKLEESLGVRLFERTTRNVILTVAGREILPAVERILADVQSLEDAAREIGTLHTARITFALPPRLAATHLPRVLARFSAEYPHASVTFRECIHEDLLSRVYSRDVDFGLTFGFEPNDVLECEVLGEDALVAIFPPAHPLALKDRLCWSDLVGYPIITLPTTSAARRLIEQQFAAIGHTLRPAYEANSLVAIALAREGLGIAIVSSSTPLLDPEGGLVQRVLNEPVVKRQLQVVTRRKSILSVPARAFIDLFAAATKETVKSAATPQRARARDKPSVKK